MWNYEGLDRYMRGKQIIKHQIQPSGAVYDQGMRQILGTLIEPVEFFVLNLILAGLAASF